MRYKQLGKTDLKVSVVAMGTWAIGGDAWGKVEDAKSIEAIQKGIDCGINLIDTAPAYGAGHAEKVVGEAIKGRRDRVFIATKCGVLRDGGRYLRTLKPESIRKEIDDSLSRLGVDVIDLYQIHWPDTKTPLEDSLAELIKIKKEGKFRYLGVSNFDTALMSQAMEITDIVSLQPPYSLLDRNIEKEILPFCRKHQLGVLAYGPLGGGILTGKFTEPPKFDKGDPRTGFYPYFKEPYWSKTMKLVDTMKEIAKLHGKPTSHVAINWVNQNDAVTTALVGAKTAVQAEENALSGEWELSREEIDTIEKAYNEIFA